MHDHGRSHGGGGIGVGANIDLSGIGHRTAEPIHLLYVPALNSRLFGFWNDLGTALRTGQPQNEIKHHGKPIFEELYASEAKLGEFLAAMTGLQAGNFTQLAEKFDFSRYKTVSDIGGALGLLSRIVGKRHRHLTFNTFDLPPVAPHAQKRIDADGMSNRIKVMSGDFLKDDLPKADVVTMGNILHDWNLEKKKVLIRKAYDALPDGGAFIAIENLIDDARRENAFGLLMSLNMLIEFGDAFEYTGADFRAWCRGFCEPFGFSFCGVNIMESLLHVFGQFYEINLRNSGLSPDNNAIRLDAGYARIFVLLTAQGLEIRSKRR